MRKVSVENGFEVVKEIASGVDILANLVKITLGPKGKNVIIDTDGGPTIMNDGVKIAATINLENRLQNMGVQMVKSVSKKTDDIAGDGTTTSTILAQIILNYGLESISANSNINLIGLQRELDSVAGIICDHLISRSIEVTNDDELYNIAKISSNNDEMIADVLVRAYKEVGKNGYITVRDPKGYEMEVSIIKGMVYDRGYLSKFFVDNRKDLTCTMDDCLIAYVDGELENEMQVIALLELAADVSKPILIIAEKFKNDALMCMIANRVEGLQCCAVNSPGISSEQVNNLSDMIAYTGGVILNQKGGKSVFDATIEDFGVCDTAEISKDNFIIRKKEFDKEAVDERIEYLKKLRTETNEQYFLDAIDTRIAKIGGGIAVIYPGGRSEVEINERKLRVEDAIKAMHSAIEMGYLPGGGRSLKYVSDNIGNIISTNDASLEKQIAIIILKKALAEPFNQILVNCGLNYNEIESISNEVMNTDDFWVGYDAKKIEYCNLRERGIIDPTKVTVNALLNAVSVSGSILTTGGAVVSLGSEEDYNQKTPLFGGM